jgi:regulator of sigma E protease
MDVLAFGFSNIGNILLVAVGLGTVIFIHELGHFMVAKWCDVKVERFSIGFGPIIWKVTRGETEYALSAIPFGGYVKMLGQDDADPGQMTDDRVAKDPRSYTAKTVPQRIAIISAGVFNNMVSAVLFFVLAFMLGVKYQPAVVGGVVPGMPAWKAGLRAGDEITRVNDRHDAPLSFTDVRLEVALSRADEPVKLEGLRNGKKFSTEVSPVTGELIPTIFVEPSQGLTLPDVESKTGESRVTVKGLSASRAEPPLLAGDEIKELDGVPLKTYAEMQLGIAARRDQDVVLSVRRKNTAPDAPLTKITIEPNHFRTLGLRMAIGQIKAIQHNSPAAGKLKEGDTMTHILSPEQRTIGVDLDPLQLPDYFAKFAGQEVRVRVKREVSGGNPTLEEIGLVPEGRPGWIERPIDAVNDCPLSIPAIGVAFNVLHHVVGVDPEGPAYQAGIKKDDNIEQIKFLSPKRDKKEEGDDEIVIKFSETDRSWPSAFWLIQMLPERAIELTFKSQGAAAAQKVEVVPQNDPDWYLPMRGFSTLGLSKTRQAENIGEAVTLGFRRTRDSIFEMWFTIRGLFSGRISPKALGGPIRIADTAYHFSKQGIPDLILFLGILSVSLSVLNFLPIPVLDGGHFAFLCWEGIRGKPPSERVVVAATYVGLAFVLSLMVFVLYMDISSYWK